MSENVPDDDFDLEAFIDLFDTAMSSNNPAVQKALKNLLMISTIVNSETPKKDQVIGPLRRMQDAMQSFNQRIAVLESRQYQNGYNVTSDIAQNKNSITYTWSGINPSTGYTAQTVGALLPEAVTKIDDYDN